MHEVRCIAGCIEVKEGGDLEESKRGRGREVQVPLFSILVV